MTKQITIRGREFKVEGPTPIYGTYLLTGAHGAAYLATQAYIGDERTLKVIAWNGHELYIKGNRVLLAADANGELVVA